jgi:hypothetical protein
MKQSRFTTEQITALLRARAASAQTTALIRRYCISRATLYHWKKPRGHREVSDATQCTRA